MINIYLICVSDFYYKNRIFDLTSDTNRDDYYYPYFLLKKRFEDYGISLNTYDYYDSLVDDFKADFIFLDIPQNMAHFNKIYKYNNKYLLLLENDAIRSINWKYSLHDSFTKIFTWNDSIIDDKYIQIRLPNKIPYYIDHIPEKSKFCTMIAGHKFTSNSKELYTERLKVIRWFEKNQPNYFDLFGIGWNSFQFKGKLSFLNRFKSITNRFEVHFPSYKGQVKTKKEIYDQYKFSICFENVRDLPGYITEKIFDSFFSYCVPVYWGASNISDLIPEDTFIDRRKFKSNEELFNFLFYMSDKSYNDYQRAIERFLHSEGVYPFSAEHFVDIIVNEVIKNGYQ